MVTQVLERECKDVQVRCEATVLRWSIANLVRLLVTEEWWDAQLGWEPSLVGLGSHDKGRGNFQSKSEI